MISIEDIPIIQMYTEKDKSRIPKGMYCYTIIKVHDEGFLEVEACPYLYNIKEKHKQENGYCAYMNFKDWDSGMGLIWDSVKECGINK